MTSDRTPPKRKPPTTYVLVGHDDKGTRNLSALCKQYGYVPIYADDDLTIEQAVARIKPPANLIVVAHGTTEGTFIWRKNGIEKQLAQFMKNVLPDMVDSEKQESWRAVNRLLAGHLPTPVTLTDFIKPGAFTAKLATAIRSKYAGNSDKIGAFFADLDRQPESELPWDNSLRMPQYRKFSGDASEYIQGDRLFELLPRKGIDFITYVPCSGESALTASSALKLPPGTLCVPLSGRHSLTIVSNEHFYHGYAKTSRAGQRLMEAIDTINPVGAAADCANSNAENGTHYSTSSLDVLPKTIAIGGVGVIPMNRYFNQMREGKFLFSPSGKLDPKITEQAVKMMNQHLNCSFQIREESWAYAVEKDKMEVHAVNQMKQWHKENMDLFINYFLRQHKMPPGMDPSVLQKYSYAFIAAYLDQSGALEATVQRGKEEAYAKQERGEFNGWRMPVEPLPVILLKPIDLAAPNAPQARAAYNAKAEDIPLIKQNQVPSLKRALAATGLYTGKLTDNLDQKIIEAIQEVAKMAGVEMDDINFTRPRDPEYIQFCKVVNRLQRGGSPPR